MTQYKTSSELKDLAKEKLKGNYGSSIALILTEGLIVLTCILAFSMIFSILYFALTTMFAGNGGGSSVSNIFTNIFYTVGMDILTVFTNVFQVGLSLFYLNLACQRNASLGDLFYGYRYQFGKACTISLILVLVGLVRTIPYNMLSSDNLSGTWTMPVIVLNMICFIIYVPLSLALSQSYFLMLDFPGLSAVETVKRSMAVMKGHKRRLFYLQLSFLPLLLLGYLSLIGFLWVIPYMSVTQALFFLDIMKPKQQAPIQQPPLQETPESNTFENVPM